MSNIQNVNNVLNVVMLLLYEGATHLFLIKGEDFSWLDLKLGAIGSIQIKNIASEYVNVGYVFG